MASIPKTRITDYILKTIIVLLFVFLVWSVVSPVQAEKADRNKIRLTRAKMKALLAVQKAYFVSDSSFTSDNGKLFDFVNKKGKDKVPDEVFTPVIEALMRFPEYSEYFKDVTPATYREQYFESLTDNPMNGQKFIIETGLKDGRKTVHIKPSSVDSEIQRIGAVIDSRVTWNEKLELTY
ncbi:MAG TPA: hypothetical protein PLH27_01400 [bacterium]|nr:hypothetical protein [bacterium]HMW32018.1 hypothetical protein [bacterium]HMW34885.1 hypothetical protein [bacterium]HMZ03039.1 hypothetical protein [bacterium]HNB08191.1 hypothetical protein [bacterium]